MATHTDGSKSEGLVGFGIFLDDSLRLPGHCGICTAEMYTSDINTRARTRLLTE
jgi:hypothetical protein